MFLPSFNICCDRRYIIFLTHFDCVLQFQRYRLDIPISISMCTYRYLHAYLRVHSSLTPLFFETHSRAQYITTAKGKQRLFGGVDKSITCVTTCERQQNFSWAIEETLLIRIWFFFTYCLQEENYIFNYANVSEASGFSWLAHAAVWRTCVGFAIISGGPLFGSQI